MKTRLFHESPSLVVALLIPFMIVPTKQYLLVFLTGILFLAYFYRHPIRVNNTSDDTIVSPCDGTVLDVLKESDTFRIVVYLSIWNVHTQWYPMDGKIVNVQYKRGEFNLAHLLEKSDYNERCVTTIQHNDGFVVKVCQIAGQVARRIVNRSRIGSSVHKGEHMGMIKLSSRVDITVPSTMTLLVKPNDKVYGNQTMLAKIPKRST